jgi:CRISPR type III-A-associated RAMP protein Csm4
MNSGFIVRLRPAGPWRLGPSTGARDRVDRVLHSDTLYSALTIAADQLGMLSEWIAATADADVPAVRVSSAFPFMGRSLFAPAPKHVWPPPGAGKVRFEAARFVPLQLLSRLHAYESLKEDRWAVDPVSECLLPVEKFGEVSPPFRIAMRRTAAVDRVSHVSSEAATTACLAFAEGAGMWCAVECSDDWSSRVQSLFRWIADAGVGGERSLGLGRSAAPEFEALPAALTATAEPSEHHEVGYLLLSLFAPAKTDGVDWSRGSYALLRRSGRTQNRGELKVESALVEEGSVLIANSAPVGFARNIAPADYGHPVYRAGFAVTIPVAVRLPGFRAMERPAPEETPVEDTTSIPDVASAPEQFTVETEPAKEADLSDEPVEDSLAVPEAPDQEPGQEESEEQP